MRRLLFPLITLVALLSAGCTLNSGEVPVTYVIITDSPEVLALTPDAPTPDSAPIESAQATEPTAEPAPTEAPTPASVLSDAAQVLSEGASGVEAGDALLHDGYFDEARAAYLPLVASNSRAAEGYAIAALQDGAFEEALAALTTYLNANPESAESARAYFLRGEANLGVARWTSAINDYRQYMTLRPGVIDSYVHERIGDAFFALNMTGDALSSYDAASAALRARVPLAALRERAARIYVTSGQHARAAAIYDEIVADSQNRAYKATIELAAADAIRDAGQQDASLTRYQLILNNYVDVPAAALPAIAALEAGGVTVSGYAKGRAYSAAGDYAAAIEAFNTFTTTVDLASIPAELHLHLGQAYRAVSNTPAALVAFRTIVEQYPTNALFGEALLEQGRTFYQGGDVPEAIRTYLRIADTYPTLTATAAEALWRAGFLHNEAGQYAEAREVFARLAESYPVSEQAVSGLNLAASAAMSSGDAALAERLYAQIAASANGETSANAYLQVALLAQTRGEQNVARQAWTDAIAAAPDTFAAARSRDWLAGRRMFAPPTSRAYPPGDTDAAQAEAEAWIRQTFGLAADVPVRDLPETITTDSRYIRGHELWALGLNAAAESEFLEMLGANTGSGAVNYALSLDFLRIGAYYPSQQAAANLISAASVGTLDAPAFIGRLRYPVPYLNLILAESEARGIDPLLMFSLIRHESLFDTYATAAAGEKGLMQVIPPTAEYIAGLLNWPDYDHSDLFRPYAGIAFGAEYIDEQLGRFGDDPVPALAGYNAGPGRAIAWRDAAGTDPDAFIAAITISTTRTYVQRIYTFYTIYRTLYGVD